jgi:putative nucleotidyltransferase with HDIG domain
MMAKEQYNILIVDDDNFIGENLSEIFTEIGNYYTDIATSPFEGLDKLMNYNFDIVLTDILMPEMNGIEFLKKIKAMDPTMPVVMITGFPTVDVAIAAMKEGASDFITKPFRFNQIKIVAEKLVRERKLLLENAKLHNALKQKMTIEKLNGRLNSKIKEISILYSISESFSGSNVEDEDMDEIYLRMVEMASEITNCSFSLLLLLDRDKEELVYGAGSGLEGYRIADSIPCKDSFVFKSMISREPLFINSPLKNPADIGIIDDGFMCHSLFLIPLMIKDEIFATLIVGEKDEIKKNNPDEIILLKNLARKASLNIENRLLYESIFENLTETLHSLVAAIEARDKYTLSHSISVTKYAMGIAQALGCSQDEMDILNSAGYLHDIGKIGINDVILLKRGNLSEKEYEIVKQHPVIGENILKPLCLIPLERSVIRHHHERWDGKGYPDRLKGDEIPLLSRIISVADSYDAITTDRPYHKALSHHEAILELKNSVDQFDQKVVDALIISFGLKTTKESTI